MAWGKNKKKKDKKAKVNVVKRPEPKPAAKVPAGKAVKPLGPKLTPVTPGSHGKGKGADTKVNIHMLGNAMVDGVQYKADTDIQVPASVFRAIGKSCVSANTWKQIKTKGGLSSINK